MARPRRELAKTHVSQFPAERLLGDLEEKLLEQPPREIDQPQRNDAMDGGDGAAPHRPPQHLALAVVENAGGARRLAVQETIRALGVETDNPVTHDLHSDAADPRRVRARPAAVNLGQRQETPGLTGIVRLPRQTPQSRTIEIIPQQKKPVRYRDLLVATLSRAICEMQARSTTLFGFVIDIERRQCAQKSGRRWRQWRPPSALPSRAASIDSGGFGPRRPSSRHFLTTASVRESTVPDRPP